MMVIVVRVKVSRLYGPCINIIDWKLWERECGFTFIGMMPNIIGMETKALHDVLGDHGSGRSNIITGRFQRREKSAGKGSEE